MNPPEDDQLLDETLAGSDLDDFRRASLERMLSANARRLRQRRLTRTGAGVLLLSLLMLTGIIHLAPAPKGPVAQAGREHPAPQPALHQAAAAAVKTISDTELFALFPNRPTALIGPPGQQDFVFLDEVSPQQAEMEP